MSNPFSMEGRFASGCVLDRRVVLQRKVETRDAAGGVVTAWATLATVWAGKRFLSGQRLYAAQAKHGLDILFYRIRHRNTVVRFMRFLHGASTYEIVDVEEVGRRQFLDLTLRGIDQAAGDNIAAA